MAVLRSRQPAVAGTFYPQDAARLQEQVHAYINSATPNRQPRPPRGLIAPHAGYAYSGSTAGAAYKSLIRSDANIQRVLLLGPSHYVSFAGLALSHFDCFTTPLGEVPVDAAAIAMLESFSQVQFLEAAHEHEHCLEVHLPFLQETLGNFNLVPIVIGSATAEQVAAVIHALWNSQTLVVASSDLSHYLDYDTACSIDAQTCAKIQHMDYQNISLQEACGARAICGLLKEADDQQMTITTLMLLNSGDTAGDRQRVVGYGAWSLH